MRGFFRSKSPAYGKQTSYAQSGTSFFTFRWRHSVVLCRGMKTVKKIDPTKLHGLTVRRSTSCFLSNSRRCSMRQKRFSFLKQPFLIPSDKQNRKGADKTGKIGFSLFGQSSVQLFVRPRLNCYGSDTRRKRRRRRRRRRRASQRYSNLLPLGPHTQN